MLIDNASLSLIFPYSKLCSCLSLFCSNFCLWAPTQRDIVPSGAQLFFMTLLMCLLILYLCCVVLNVFVHQRLMLHHRNSLSPNSSSTALAPIREDELRRVISTLNQKST